MRAVYVIRRRAWILISFLGGVVGITALLTYTATPLYKATALIKIEPERPSVMGKEDIYYYGYTRYMWDYYYQTQHEILTSHDLCEKVMQRLPDGITSKFKGLKDPVGAFIKRIDVRPEKATLLAKVSFIDEDPKDAARVTNTLIDVYMQDLTDRFQKVKGATATWLKEEAIPGLEKRIAELEQELKGFQKECGVLGTTQGLEMPQNIEFLRWRSLNKELADLEVERIALKTEYEDLKRLKGAGEAIYSQPAIMRNRLIRYLRMVKSSLEVELAERSKELGADHPEVLGLKDAIDKVLSQLNGEVSRIIDGKKDQLEAIKRREDLLRERLKAQQQIVADLNAKILRMEGIRSELATTRSLYDYYVQKYGEAASASHAQLTNISVVDRARPPTRPYIPDKLLNLSLAVILGLLGGLVLAFTVDYFDDRLRHSEQVERVLQTRVLGSIPILDGGYKGTPVLLGEAPVQVLESFRALRTEVISNCSAKGLKSVTILSPGALEGKTAIAANLAVSLASIGKKVLLIDADLRNHSLHSLFGCDKQNKFSDYLAGQKGIEEIIYRSNLGLDVISSPEQVQDASELLESARVDSLLEFARRSYDYVIIDTPAVLPSPDGLITAKRTDASIMVIRLGLTRQQDALATRKQLLGLGINQIGVVVTYSTQ